MRYVKVIDAARRVAVADRVGVAETPSSRRRGLLGTDALAEGEGLLLVPCRQVHTFGMRYPVDVVFLDGSHRVVRVAGSLKPWRLSPVVWRARAVLELPAGRTERTGITEGNLLEVISLPEG